MVEHEPIDFENFINYENDVPTGEVLSDEDIVSIVRNESKEADEDIVLEEIVEAENKPVTFCSVVESIDNLFKFNQEKECLSVEELSLLMKLTNKLKYSQFNVKQATLDNFVNKE